MRPLHAELSLDAFAYNLQQVARRAPSARIIVVVKANAYGHGVTPLLPVLNQQSRLAVACIEEAHALRAAGATPPIILLEGVFEPSEYYVCSQAHFEPVIQHKSQLKGLSDLLAGHHVPQAIWVKVDTGMNRLGVSVQEVAEICQHVAQQLPGIPINLISHLACADELNHPHNQRQFSFWQVLSGQQATLGIAQKTILNSAGIIHFPEYAAEWVRPGLMLYGVSPIMGLCGADLDLQPVMTLTSQLIATKYCAQGDYIGYTADFCAQRRMHIGVVAGGYADGYPREVGADAFVLVNGRPAPIVGRISMDMLTVDISDIAHAQVGSRVLLWGADLPVEQVSAWAQTSPYTVLTHVASRVQRVVVDKMHNTAAVISR